MIWDDLTRDDSPDAVEARRPRPRKRRFKAAKHDRLTAGFNTGLRTMDQDLRSDLQALTARARDLAKNDDYVRRALRVSKNNIIGEQGIILRPQYRSNFGQGQDPAKATIDAVQSHWRAWGENPEVSGTMSWHDCQGFVVHSMARDGEVLILKHDRGPYAFQIQFLDPMQLAHRLNRVLNDEREIIMGVEIHRAYRYPTAYWIHALDDSQPDTFQFDSHHYRRIPAERVIHLCRREEVYQTRGFSSLVSAIERLNMLNGYEDAALVAARASASKMGFYVQGDGDQAYEGDDESASDEFIEEFEPGIMGRLPRGWDVKSFDTGWPNVNHTDYLKTILRGVASGVGVSYNTLANDLEGVNFSSLRSSVLEDREEWRMAQKFFIDNFCQPVFEGVLEAALLFGFIKHKGQAYRPERFEEFRKVSWQGRRWEWVDPAKDMSANTDAIHHGIKSISDVIREQGRDPDDVFEEIARERDRLAELGIEVQTNGNSLPAPTAPDGEGE